MIFRRRKPAPELTSDGYRRWLRAQRPPLPWFLDLSELEQETLAQLGDEQLQDFAIAIGYAVRDPDAADQGVAAAAGDADAEASLAVRLASKILGSMPQKTAPTSYPGNGTMAGLGERRKVRTPKAAADLFPGVKPDSVEEVLGP